MNHTTWHLVISIPWHVHFRMLILKVPRSSDCRLVIQLCWWHLCFSISFASCWRNFMSARNGSPAVLLIHLCSSGWLQRFLLLTDLITPLWRIWSHFRLLRPHECGFARVHGLLHGCELIYILDLVFQLWRPHECGLAHVHGFVFRSWLCT